MSHRLGSPDCLGDFKVLLRSFVSGTESAFQKAPVDQLCEVGCQECLWADCTP